MRKFYFLLQSWRDIAQVVLTALSSFCFAITGVIGIDNLEALYTSWAWVWPVGGIAFALTLVLGRLFFFRPTYGDLIHDRNERIAELELHKQAHQEALTSHAETLQSTKERHRRDLQTVLDSLVTQLLEYVCKDATDSRVSAYSVEGSEFLLLSRCSRNPLLEVRGRPSYPLTGGNIGQAWAKGWAIQDHESTDRNEWEETLVESSLFTVDTARLLTMQSRSIYAQRIDSGTDKVGMVVFECENHGRFDLKTLKKVRASLILKSIAEILQASHANFPRAVERQEELTSATPTAVIPEPEWKRARPILQSDMKMSDSSERE